MKNLAMKSLIYPLLLLMVFAFSACELFAQRTTSIFRDCPGVLPSIKIGKVEIKENGDIDLIPCFGRQLLLNGQPFQSGTGIASLNGLQSATQTFSLAASDNVGWSSGLSTHTLSLPITQVTGASRTNYLPYFNAAHTLAKADILYNGTDFKVFDTSDVYFRLGKNTLAVMGSNQNYVRADHNNQSVDISSQLQLNLGSETISLIGKIAVPTECSGQLTLVAGTVSETSSCVTTSSLILITKKGANTANVTITAQGAGTFTLTSADNSDTSQVNYFVIQP